MSGPQVRALSLVPSPLFLHADGGGRQLVAAVGGSQSAGCSRRLFTEQAFFRPLSPGLARVLWIAEIGRRGMCRDCGARGQRARGWACSLRVARREASHVSSPPVFFCQSTSPFTLSKTECSKQVKRGGVKTLAERLACFSMG